MIVTCEECSTSFQLDDARIPASGARVRCSRCKHAFFLPNPSTSASQAVQAIVEDVVQGAAGRTPEPARDLVHPGSEDREGRPVRAEPEEEDWEFSQEIRVADDEADAPDVGGPAPRADSFDLTGDFGRGFDPETFDREEPEPTTRAGSERDRAKPPVSDAAREAASFGSVEDFSAMMEDEALSIDVDPEPAPRRSARSAPASAASASPPLGSAAASDDLGDPESWDLVGGEGSRHASSRVAALARPAAAPRRPRPALELFDDAELPPVREAAAATPRVWKSPRWALVGHVLGWGVALAAVLAVGGLLLRSEWSRWSDAPQRLELGPLVASTTRSGWLESSRAGLLLVLEGELRNTGATPLAPAPLQLRLLDGAGRPLAAPALEAGLPLDDFVLREATPERLAAERDRAVAGWSVLPLAPGETRRFLAISTADAVPAAAQRFLLEAGGDAARSGRVDRFAAPQRASGSER